MYISKRTTYTDHVVRMATSYITKFFSKGWGDLDILRQLAEWQTVPLNKRKMLKDVYKVLEKTEIKVSAGKKINSSHVIYKGQFVSPLTKFIPNALPPESETVYFEMVLPQQWRDKKPVCIHLAGTGDHFFWRRRHFMGIPLVKTCNMGSIILENPFYGSRKPKNQIRSSVNHVSDIFVMGAALLFESITLMLWSQRNGFGPLGITGISMGGHMATVASSGWYDPLAIIPCLSWSSAAPAFTEGVLSHSVDWKILERQLSEKPSEYKNILRDDLEFHRHYVNKEDRCRMEQDQSSSQSNDSASNSGLIYSKFSSALSGLQLSSYLDLRGKKIGPIALEVDLWKYIESLPKQIYNSANSRLNLDYLRELSFNQNGSSQYPSKETVEYMTAIMDQSTHLSYFNKPHRDSAVTYVVAEHDQYIPREFYHVTPSDIWPNVEVRTIDSGHVVGCLNHQADFRLAIKDAYTKIGCNFD